MTTFRDVVEGWKIAPVTAIHPLRAVDQEAYWQSGREQALDAARWIPEGGWVLDFGCGEGRVAIPLAKLGFRVIGVDSSLEMLRRTYENDIDHDIEALVPSEGFPPDPIWSGGDLDAIVCRAVLIHHSHYDVTKLVEAFSLGLKPGGYLIADWPVGDHYERQNWTDVTTWRQSHRHKVAKAAGFEMVRPGTDAHGSPSVWRKL